MNEEERKRKKVVSRAKQLRLLKAAQLGREVTLREVFEATGIAISTLSRIESGKAKGIEFETLVKLAEFYGISNTNELISIEDARLALRLALA